MHPLETSVRTWSGPVMLIMLYILFDIEFFSWGGRGVWFALVAITVAGRLWVRARGGVTLPKPVFADHNEMLARATHILSAREYWALGWTYGYCATGDYDPLPCVNLPLLVVDGCCYAVFLAVVRPLVWGPDAPVRYRWARDWWHHPPTEVYTTAYFSV